MEYLTIHEPRTSHFRGMDSYKNDQYSRESRQHPTQPTKTSPVGRLHSPPLSHHQSDPSSATSTSEWRKWPEVSTPPGNHLPPPTSISDRIPAIHSGQESTSRLVPGSYSSVPRSSNLSQPRSPDWDRPAQPTPNRPTGSTVGPLASSEMGEEQKPLKLPSFNSLVKQLSSETSPISPASSSLPQTLDPWKRSDQYPPPPLEPIPYPLARPSGITQSSPTAHHLSTSEPPSPQVYSANSASHPPFSPRGRATTPARHHRSGGHSRRSSDLRSRAYSQQPQPQGGTTATSYAPPPVSHHHHHHHQRTQTFPSYPPPPSYKPHEKSIPPYSNPPPPLPPPQQLPLPEYRPALPHSIAPHPQPQLSGLPGHGRTDSVLNHNEGGYYPNGASVAPGPPGSAVSILHVHHHHQQRKRRGNLPKDATMILRRWFDEHLEAPYPGEEVKHSLCLQTGLQMSQVNNWFINARRRLPRDPERPGAGAPGSVTGSREGRRSVEDGAEESPTTAPSTQAGGSRHRPHDYWT